MEVQQLMAIQRRVRIALNARFIAVRKAALTDGLNEAEREWARKEVRVSENMSNEELDRWLAIPAARVYEPRTTAAPLSEEEADRRRTSAARRVLEATPTDSYIARRKESELDPWERMSRETQRVNAQVRENKRFAAVDDEILSKRGLTRATVPAELFDGVSLPGYTRLNVLALDRWQQQQPSPRRGGAAQEEPEAGEMDTQ